MNGLGSNPRVIRLAQDLGLATRGDCLGRLREHALDRVGRLLSDLPVRTLGELRSLLAASLSVQFEFLSSDEDIARLALVYHVFHRELKRLLAIEFIKGDTEGLLLRHPNPQLGEREYLAIIDSRADRAWRAYFTAWHELTHLLLTPPQMAFPGFRRAPSEEEKNKEPIESVVDHITGYLAFYEPMFRPAIESAITNEGGLTLRAIEQARSSAVPEASFFASAIAAMRFVSQSACLVQVDLALKKQEARQLDSRQISLALNIAKPVVEAKLRVVKVVPSGSLRSTIPVFRNMRVPPESALYRAYYDGLEEDQLEAIEDMSWWETTSGGPLQPLKVHVFATRRGQYVYGLIISLS